MTPLWMSQLFKKKKPHSPSGKTKITQSAWLGVSAESTTFALGVEMITGPQVSSVSREGTCRSLLMARGLSRDTKAQRANHLGFARNKIALILLPWSLGRQVTHTRKIANKFAFSLIYS